MERSGTPDSPVFCGKEAPLYGAIEKQKMRKNDLRKVNVFALNQPGPSVIA
ncbi:MAG: hypothetical protein LBK77_01075 [Spirochaetaceae bacterium]|jgi:hypothetical protein|nr:hypothetical protein [Spirochaetaceae bacterium]